MRDGSMSMRTFIEINDNNFTKIDPTLKQYVKWVIHAQNQVDPN